MTVGGVAGVVAVAAAAAVAVDGNCSGHRIAGGHGQVRERVVVADPRSQARFVLG